MSKDEGLSVKKKDFSKWYTEIIQKADLADIRFGIQGFIVHKPCGFFIIRKICEFLEEELEKEGHLPFLFPTVVKEDNLKKEKEHAGFTPNVFWVTQAGSDKLEEKFALRPTGEAQIYPLYALWFRSYNDLPFKGYQSRIPAFRNEMTTRPFLRGREFLFFETHDVFLTHEESLKQIKKDLEICKNVIYGKLKIPFLYFKRPQWDKFKGADDSFTPDTIMPDGKRNQLASTHDLGQNFSKAFDIKIIGKDKKEMYVWQTCFGPGIWRIMAALISIHGDDEGLVLPFDIVPVQVVIVPVIFSNKKSENVKIFKKCKEIESKLKYRVKFDDSEETPGYKYNKWDLCGVPIRIEIGPKELKENKLTLVKRTDGKRIKINSNNLEKEVERNAKLVNDYIKKEADKYFKGNTKNANSLKELKNLLEKHRGFVRVSFCSVEMDGEKCANTLQEETDGGNVCGTLYPKEEKVKNQKCIICSKKAKHIVYVAKSY